MSTADEKLWIVAAFGAIALIGVLVRMKPGFGPFNLRAIGLVVVGTLASVLAIVDGNALTPAIGILGAIAGYLFGLKDKV